MTNQQKEPTFNKEPIICGILTTLAFIGAAAILYFTSSKQFLKMTGLVLAAISIPAGLIIYCCSTLNSKLQSVQTSNRNLKLGL